MSNWRRGLTGTIMLPIMSMFLVNAILVSVYVYVLTGKLVVANKIVTLSLVAAVIETVVLGRLIRNPITNLGNTLRRGAEEVATGAKQFASISQELASGASQQAAAIEETSASLEEMSSVTRQNSENAQRVQGLAEKARQAAFDGDTVMREMNLAIGEIKSAADDVQKIVKIIDEIAFQTGLLALNAAVEAAHAGDAGRGFAVVADEVRNLAKRSTAASKISESKIETAVQKANVGVETAGKVASSFNVIRGHVKQVAQLIHEISAASEEQSQGIAQVTIAVHEVDKVVQSNVTHAQEAASTSEHISAQADELLGEVRIISNIVSGANQASPSSRQKDVKTQSQDLLDEKKRTAPVPDENPVAEPQRS